MLYTLFRRPGDENVNVTSVMLFVMLTWSLFPIVWMLAPTGLGVFTTLVGAILYLALDFTTKIAFGLYIPTQQNFVK
jgi:bacteriorhodopsin